MNKFINSNINQFDIEWDPYGFTNNDKWFLDVEKTEDILQLAHIYSEGPIIDLGWYRNTFKIHVVKNCDWDNPVEVIENRTAEDSANNIYKLIDKYSNGFENKVENK
jgi:hypothetical protein